MMQPPKERHARKFLPERQSWLLADAILRLLNWQSRQLNMKEERKIKAMITRQRNLRMRQNGKS